MIKLLALLLSISMAHGSETDRHSTLTTWDAYDYYTTWEYTKEFRDNDIVLVESCETVKGPCTKRDLDLANTKYFEYFYDVYLSYSDH